MSVLLFCYCQINHSHQFFVYRGILIPVVSTILVPSHIVPFSTVEYVTLCQSFLFLTSQLLKKVPIEMESSPSETSCGKAQCVRVKNKHKSQKEHLFLFQKAMTKQIESRTSENTPLYKKDKKQSKNRPMETTQQLLQSLRTAQLLFGGPKNGPVLI